MASTDTERKPSGLKAIRIRRAGPGKPKKEKKPKPVVSQMTFFEHLSELRNRLVWSAVAVVITTAISWFFSGDILNAFTERAKVDFPGVKFISTELVQNFSVYFELSLQAGLLLASPILVYHILAFLAPALEPETQPGEAGYEEEVKMLGSIRRSLVFFIPLVALFFLGGVAFAYYLVLPPAIHFFLTVGQGQFEALPSIKPYVALLAKVMFWSGLVFELPMIMFLLAKIRLVTWQRMVKFWKWALVLSLVAAAFITPSPEIFSQAIISIPVYGLFWLGVLFARFAN
ncbi:MAG: twin-arginine translocase subunit TatC [Chloroflexi bacterium]|nr:twin-arginine translocase subunit TatC [Chloroflexota bacterium]OJW03224.1 MAG: twin arginine-targeting protein translocase TatC [Chloroflexi bacterium 54-19]